MSVTLKDISHSSVLNISERENVIDDSSIVGSEFKTLNGK